MTARSVLIADDDATIRTVLAEALTRQDFTVRLADNAAALSRQLAAEHFDLLIADLLMPDGNNLERLPQIKRDNPQMKIIVITAQNTLRMAIDVTALDVYAYFPKPFDLDQLLQSARNAVIPNTREDGGDFDVTGKAASLTDPALPLVGIAPSMQAVFQLIAKAVTSDFTVLITGESGTGKDLIARALHRYGPRRDRPFVALNMAAIPKDLIETELFGHEKGAFTGALNRHAGKFEQADGGSLFLDEIGDMPMEAQTRLLRVLQDGDYTAVGGREKRRANARIIAATHRNLPDLIAAGQFREDLYYRLNVIQIPVPPLRARRPDIAPLAQHFLERFARAGQQPKKLSKEAVKRLQAYAWPGNVRELENVIRRICTLTSDENISADIIHRQIFQETGREDAIPAGDTQAVESSLGASVSRHLREYFAAHQGTLPPSGLYDRVLREVERPLIALVLEATGGNQLRAATILGLNRNTLRKKMMELDIPLTKIQK